MVDEESAPLPPPPLLPEAAPELPPIGFHNKVAIRVAMLAGVLGFFVSALTGSFMPIPMSACGFLAVYWYRKRTGQRLTWWNGAHLGWITGLFGFLMATILLTLLAVALSQPEVVAMMREQWKTLAKPESDLTQMIDLFSTPAKLAAVLSVSFVVFTLFPAVGGAMGAFLLGSER